MRVFKAEYAKKLKINYKGGQSYTATHVAMISVFQTYGGGHDIEYTTEVGCYVNAVPSSIVSDLKQFYIGSQDVLSIELKGARINGIELDYAKKVFIK
jgi:hypothetical protein